MAVSVKRKVKRQRKLMRRTFNRYWRCLWEVRLMDWLRDCILSLSFCNNAAKRLQKTWVKRAVVNFLTSNQWIQIDNTVRVKPSFYIHQLERLAA